MLMVLHGVGIHIKGILPCVPVYADIVYDFTRQIVSRVYNHPKDCIRGILNDLRINNQA